jgi:hypothetical protein
MASRCDPRAMKMTSSPARASRAPKYPPTAPAPKTAMRMGTSRCSPQRTQRAQRFLLRAPCALCRALTPPPAAAPRSQVASRRAQGPHPTPGGCAQVAGRKSQGAGPSPHPRRLRPGRRSQVAGRRALTPTPGGCAQVAGRKSQGAGPSPPPPPPAAAPPGIIASGII